MCETPGAALVAALPSLDVARCGRCGTGFVAALHLTKPGEDAYDRAYEAERTAGKPAACWSLLASETGDIPAGLRLLDVGCGHGAFLDRARAVGLRTSGLDASPAAVAAARASGHDARLASASDQAFDDATRFDLITMWDVLEHLEQPRRALQRSLQWLAPAGRLVLLTPAMGSLFDRAGLAIYSAAGARADRLLRMCWTAEHLSRFDPVGLCGVLREMGFVNVRGRRVQVLSLHASHYAGGSIMPAWSRISRVNRAFSRLAVAGARALRVTNKVVVVAERSRAD